MMANINGELHENGDCENCGRKATAGHGKQQEMEQRKQREKDKNKSESTKEEEWWLAVAVSRSSINPALR